MLSKSPAFLECKKFVCVSDFHIPFQSDACLEALKQYLLYEKPDYVWLLGDVFDCLIVSKFTNIHVRYHDWEEERQASTIPFDFLDNAMDQAGVKHKLYGAGNHEQRLPMYMALHADKINSPEFTIPTQFKLKERGIRYFDSTCREGFFQKFTDKLSVSHGWISSGDNVAGLYLRKYPGMSYIVGHTHRADNKRNGSPHLDNVCYVNGCMSLNATYKPLSNETRGFTAGWVNMRTGDFDIFPIQIVGDHDEERSPIIKSENYVSKKDKPFHLYSPSLQIEVKKTAKRWQASKPVAL
jgi:UDP-2,3-diacylglucosamine pyrophosphatase LpxH